MALPVRISALALTALMPPFGSGDPAYVHVARSIAQLVVDGRIAVETRLPSERDLAAAVGRSRATVTAAYDQLRAEGFLDSRTGAGSFVRVPAGSRPRSTSGWHTRQSHPDDDVIDLTMAMFPTAPPQLPEIAAAAVAGLGNHLGDVGYDPAGLPELRAAIAERFVKRGVPTRPEHIMVTNGALHGLDLLSRLLLSTGDRVVMEIPNYPSAVAAVHGNGGRVVPAPLTETGGWHTEQLVSVLRHARPRLAYLTPDFHNPSGALVPEAERRAVLTAARRAGTTVVVDETWVELGFVAPETPMAALDRDVVTVGSMSKAVWGGLRVGWVRAGVDLIGRLAALRTTIDIASPTLEQLVAVAVLARLDDIVPARVGALARQLDALRGAIAAELPAWRMLSPQGGLSLWVRLDAPLSTPLAALAERAGVVLVPGSRFGVDGSLEHFLRLPYTHPSERLREAVSRIAPLWRDLTGTGPALGSTFRGARGASRLVVA